MFYQPSHCCARRSPLAPTDLRMLIFSLAYLSWRLSKAVTSSFPVTDLPCFLRKCCSRTEAHSFSTARLCCDVNLDAFSNACFTNMSITVWHLKRRITNHSSNSDNNNKVQKGKALYFLPWNFVTACSDLQACNQSFSFRPEKFLVLQGICVFFCHLCFTIFLHITGDPCIQPKGIRLSFGHVLCCLSISTVLHSLLFKSSCFFSVIFLSCYRKIRYSLLYLSSSLGKLKQTNKTNVYETLWKPQRMMVQHNNIHIFFWINVKVLFIRTKCIWATMKASENDGSTQ